MKGLYNGSHCEPGCGDYTSRVLVLAPQALSGKDISPDNQLFVAEAGCGCSPVTHGRKVFGQFLESGECAQFERRDFLGVLKREHLPPLGGEQAGGDRGTRQLIDRKITYIMKRSISLEKIRTMAFQVLEETFQRLKDYLKRHEVKQRTFVVGLVEAALDKDETARQGEGDGNR